MNQSRARCISCRAEVLVPDSYAEGAQISCGSCATQMKIVRAGGLRLVIADPLALRETLRQVKADITQASRELQEARASWGIGVNGFGLGVLYVVARVALEERRLDRGLIIEAVVLSVLVGVVLELVNYLFLAKRQAISRLTEQIRLAEAERKDLERKIRESSRR
ncbi:MAG: hypothetical protein K1Y01_11415 [Vicinamibacteria bacterium]|nr:hypothetical protein [Vicinamibacteria bacterium]